MSQPTRGMVAGQPIQTQAQTKEFDEGYERVFGADRRPTRGRYVYIDGIAHRIDEDWTDTPRQPLRVDISYMDGLAAQDGSDISSKRKRREYMRAHGVTDASDYSDEFRNKEKAAQKRSDAKARREAVARAYYQKFKP